jgi:hypothetical protein
MGIDRRYFLRALSFIPLTAKAALTQHSPDAKTEKVKKGIHILRLFNTAEAWQKARTGEFAKLALLRNSEALQELLSDSYADEELGIGRSLYETFFLDQKEIVSGWKLSLMTSEDRQSYTLTLFSTTNDGLAFVTDDEGKIYQSNALAKKLDTWPPSAREVTAEISSQRRRAKLMAIGAYLGLPIAFFACPIYCGDCPCGWSCQSFVPPGCHSGFYNCGCPACVWCVCPWCGSGECMRCA